jgi:hypothetical protein
VALQALRRPRDHEEVRSGAEVAREIGVPPAKLAETFAKYNAAAERKRARSGRSFSTTCRWT